ncbi:ABC transporter permease [Butyrivibrio sp. XPD2006]|uniref:ABC transporter permease n=1 Tax=Butyrivibrio sp. XPD2006 TaxID=1280668 RepID=UPI0003B4790D|nr:ABC transporter permease [Butyrivibrio sp. XPD2006]
MDKKWTTVIDDDSKKRISIRELSEYRYMIYMLFKRNYKLIYQQTLLGPLWLVLGPVFSSGIFSLIFGYIGRFDSDGIPYFLFSITANILWITFQGCVNKNANIFQDNAYLYGKVYFPRLAVPLANMFYALMSFVVRLLVCAFVWLFYLKRGQAQFTGMALAFALICPVLVTVLGTSIGMLISSLSVKYRDLAKGTGFIVQLFLYTSPVIYSTAQIPEKIRFLFYINPLTGFIECFRYGFTGAGKLNISSFVVSLITTVVITVISVVVYERISRDAVDIV